MPFPKGDPEWPQLNAPRYHASWGLFFRPLELGCILRWIRQVAVCRMEDAHGRTEQSPKRIVARQADSFELGPPNKQKAMEERICCVQSCWSHWQP